MKLFNDTNTLKTGAPIFFFFIFLLLCSTAGPVCAQHHNESAVDEHHEHHEHHDGDGHDHGPGNKAIQLNEEGIALYKNGNYPAAAEKFKEAVTLAPNSGEIYGMLGKTQEKLGDFKEAVINLEKSLELTKNEMINRLTHKSLARAYIGLGKYDEARREIDAYKALCEAQGGLTPQTEQIIQDLYDSLK